MRTLFLWQLRVLIFGILCVGLCLYFADSLNFLNQIALIIAIINLFVIVVYLPIFFKTYKIELKDEAIIVNHGIIVKISHIMPYSRLIYAQSFSSPLARIFKMSMVTLKAARSWIIIPEIENESANIIIDYLSSEERNGKEV